MTQEAPSALTLDDVRASPKAVLTVTDVAHLLELDERTVRRGCQDGDLPCVKVGRRLLVPRLPLLALLGANNLETESEAGPASPATATTDQASKEPSHDTQYAARGLHSA